MSNLCTQKSNNRLTSLSTAGFLCGVAWSWRGGTNYCLFWNQHSAIVFCRRSTACVFLYSPFCCHPRMLTAESHWWHSTLVGPESAPSWIVVSLCSSLQVSSWFWFWLSLCRWVRVPGLWLHGIHEQIHSSVAVWSSWIQ